MRITRPVAACVLACALLASAAPAVTARPVAEERYLASYGTPATDDGTAAAQAQEDYYKSYGAPAAQESASDGTPWLPIALGSVALALS